MSYKIKNSEKFVSIIKHCPVCGKNFKNQDRIDTFIKGKVCESGHRFFIPTELATTNGTEREFLSLRVDDGDVMNIAKTWLTQRKYRVHLSDQVAEILRTYLEIKAGGLDLDIQKERDFKFCPICGEVLTEFKQDDAWVMGRKCKNEHRFLERGSKLHYISAQELCMDPGLEILKTCTNTWLTDKYLASYIPSQVKELLEYFKENSKFQDK